MAEEKEPSQTWEISPREGVGPLRLGATREEIRKHLPGKLMTLRRFAFSPFPEDRVQDAGLMVDYDLDGRAEFIEFYGPLSPTLGGKPLLERRPFDVARRLRKLDPRLEVDGDDIESARLGLAMRVSNDRRIGSVGVFRERRTLSSHRLRTSVSEHRQGLIGSRIYTRFDMSRAEVRKRFGRTPIVRGRGRDVAPRLGVEVQYDEDERPVRIIARAPAVPTVGAQMILGRAADEVVRWFREIDRGLQVDARTIATPRFGLRFEVRRKKIASVTIFADPEHARLPGAAPPPAALRSERLAWSADGMRVLGQDAQNLFCSTGGGLHGRILRVPKAGGAPAVVVPASVDVNSDVVIAGGRLFYIADVTSLVMEAALDGTFEPRPFGSAPAPAWGRVATDGRNVFWTSEDEDQLLRKPAQGGAEEVLARELDIKTDLVVAGGHVCFFGSYRRDAGDALWGLLRVPRDGGAVEQLDCWRGNQVHLRAHDGHLSWIIIDEARRAYMTARPPEAPSGAAPACLHADDDVEGLLVRNAHAHYWIHSDERLWKRAHGAAEAVLHHDLNCHADGLLADDEAVYWADRTGGVWRCPA